MHLPTDLTEAEFLEDVVELAKLSGWIVWHSIPTQIRPGRWVTAGKGHKGFPDLCLAHPDHGAFFLELKVGRNQPSIEQVQWIETLNRAGVEAYVAWPKDMEAIIGRLRGVAWP